MTALGNIREAFVVKSKGGADAAGQKWPPLARSTVAYSRRHPGVPKASQRAAFRPSWMLTQKQRERWWEVYRSGLARFRGDMSRAARAAWAAIKAGGAKTLIGTYGDTPVMILRDLGLLLNSLSPGATPGAARPSLVDVEDQVFLVGPGSVIVGTNRKWAGSHHYGVPGKIPQRRLWPEPADWPSEWWEDLLDQAKAGMIDIFVACLRNRR